MTEILAASPVTCVSYWCHYALPSHMSVFSVMWWSVLFAGNLKSSKIWSEALFSDSVIYCILLLNFPFFVCLILFYHSFVPHSSLAIEIGGGKERERQRESERKRWGEGSPFLATHLHMNTAEHAPFHTLSSTKIPTSRHYNTHPTGLSYPQASSHSENMSKHLLFFLRKLTFF